MDSRVRPAFRRRGVGEALLGAAASWAKPHDFGTLLLWVTESDDPARRLYGRLGFTPTGARQPLPSDPAQPEIELSRPLKPFRSDFRLYRFRSISRPFCRKYPAETDR